MTGRTRRTFLALGLGILGVLVGCLSEGGIDDVTTDTMLVRVETEGRSVTAARATIYPQYGDPVRLSTEDGDREQTGD